MIPKVIHGSKMVGLVVYLAGPGKANEHENPHIVAGHNAVVMRAPSGELSHADAIEIAHEIDTPRVLFGTEVLATNRKQMDAAIDSGVPRSVALADATHDQNTWHCSLSLNPDEGELTDAAWGAIATDFMKEMGFDDPDDPRSPARWVAIRHGKTTAGGDHIHIAASVVREDGTKVSLRRDFNRAQTAVNVLEHRYGLTVLTSREKERGTRGLEPAEIESTRRSGAAEPVRHSLERRVRAAATASKTEAEFVRRLRGDGVLVRPRYEKGTTGEVVGYSVAAAPSKAERATGNTPVWYGGGRLSKDLTLPRLRDEWDTSADANAAAAAEWRAARTRATVTRGNGRERAGFDPALYARAAADMETWNAYLASVPASDRAQWARASGRAAGVFAAWSARIEPTPGPLAAASASLAQSAQIPAHSRGDGAGARMTSAAGAALIVLQATTTDPTAATALLLHQMMRTLDAIAAAHRASGEAQRAAQLVAVRERHLDALHAQLSNPMTAASAFTVDTRSRRGGPSTGPAARSTQQQVADIVAAQAVSSAGSTGGRQHVALPDPSGRDEMDPRRSASPHSTARRAREDRDKER
ncbi:relaxase/mobilization nuclease domain-containing protein [Rhodococcoides fascians]|uniref:relaxase/mobilization nuclease domain-containing protein n=1 Tax=Rhodococcoides fascians TaxID=1828 RepID=UPI000AA009C5|nr:hypothetical protein [Rhodococcus fascians]